MFKNLLILLVSTVGMAQAGVYHDLEFGDSKANVISKLKTSAQMTPNVPEDMIDQATNLNGIFEVKTPLKNTSFSLHFSWDESDKLEGITLRSEPMALNQYKTSLSSAFDTALQLITEVHGEPLMAQPMPAADQITEGKALHSHLWPNKSGTILMGVASEGDSYQVSITFTQKEIRP